MLVHGDWLLTPQRVVVHVPTATAVVADLHLGYSEARCGSGEAVPLPDLQQLLAPLRRAVLDQEVRRLVVAGDLFETAAAASLAGDLLDWLRAAGLELAGVVPGNHDRSLRQDGSGLPVCPEGFRLGGWRVVHGDGDLPAGPVLHGHFHPCLRWGQGIAAPCYLVGKERLVLPAFSGDAAGVNVLGDPRWRSCRCCVPVGDKILDFGELLSLRRQRRFGC